MNHKSEQPCIIFVGYLISSFATSLVILMQRLLEQGWQVVIATTLDDYAQKFRDLGVIVEPVFFNRKGLAIKSDTQACLELIKIYRQYNPDIIHHFNSKPMMLGTLATAIASKNKIVNTVTGLGFVFVKGGTTSYVASLGYQLFLNKCDATVFQNPDDRQLFIDKGWIEPDKAQLIISAGVDIQKFHPPTNKTPNQKTKILMVCRLIWYKGVKEFVEAAEIVKQKYPDVCFQLGGDLELTHPNGVEETWIQAQVEQGLIEFIGHIDDMPNQLQQTDIFILPSYYREGVPRVLLEAAACGVPVITTNSTGCKEAVADKETGFLVEPQNSQALADAIVKILANPELGTNLGKTGRKRIEEKFDIEIITDQYLSVYRSLGCRVRSSESTAALS